MKLLTFAAQSFAWQTHSRTLDDVPERHVVDQAEQVVVAFLHIEARDQSEQRQRVFRHTLKHIKWIANKFGFKRVVLHSFTHLGGVNAEAEFAAQFIDELAGRLAETNYQVKCTPFGHFCAWSIDVLGDSLAKVFKEIAPQAAASD